MLCVLFGLLVLLAACARPLTDSENAFAEAFFGEKLDTSKVSISMGVGLTPAQPIAKTLRVELVTGTDQACVRVPQPLATRQPAQAFAVYNRMHFNPGLYSGDMALLWPDRVRFPQLLILGHELTHVWQWQNRSQTAYTPWRALKESFQLGDPYFAPPGEDRLFFAFGYEQQAAMVEDYLCFLFANPDHPRRHELREILSPVFPIDAFETSIPRRLN